MNYNSNCVNQECQLDCCNIDGNCPSLSSECYYYYENIATIAAD
jgi:hypothetical protein